MTDSTRPVELDAGYATVLRSPKASFVEVNASGTALVQHGAAIVPMSDWPGWPQQLPAAAHGQREPIIETFVAGPDQITATSDNEPFVSAWQPIARWMNTTVRSCLFAVGVELAGDAYVTASLTPSAALEGIAHLDDELFVPGDSVSMVAIVGEHAGTRVARGELAHRELRPHASVQLGPEQLEAFANNQVSHCECAPDELVIFPQFGQLHAGPAARHVEHLGATRQLLVMRGAVTMTD